MPDGVFWPSCSRRCLTVRLECDLHTRFSEAEFLQIRWVFVDDALNLDRREVRGDSGDGCLIGSRRNWLHDFPVGPSCAQRRPIAGFGLDLDLVDLVCLDGEDFVAFWGVVDRPLLRIVVRIPSQRNRDDQQDDEPQCRASIASATRSGRRRRESTPGIIKDRAARKGLLIARSA